MKKLITVLFVAVASVAMVFAASDKLGFSINTRLGAIMDEYGVSYTAGNWTFGAETLSISPFAYSYSSSSDIDNPADLLTRGFNLFSTYKVWENKKWDYSIGAGFGYDSTDEGRSGVLQGFYISLDSELVYHFNDSHAVTLRNFIPYNSKLAAGWTDVEIFDLNLGALAFVAYPLIACTSIGYRYSF